MEQYYKSVLIIEIENLGQRSVLFSWEDLINYFLLGKWFAASAKFF